MEFAHQDKIKVPEAYAAMRRGNYRVVIIVASDE